MKQIYTITLALAAFTAGLGASAATATAKVTKSDRARFELTAPAKAKAESFRRVGAAAELKATTVSRAASTPAKAPAGTWESIGKGTYCEDLLTLFSDVDAGQQWQVDVEQSTTTPGWYRLLPYASGPVAEMLGRADTQNYLYINATNPQKVYAEDFTAFGAFPFSNMVPENDWEDGAQYGTLADNIISFPTQSFAIDYNGWTLTTRNTGLKLYLPGAAVKDYSFTIKAPFCAADNKVTNDFVCGADIDHVKVVLLEGEYECSGQNAAIVASEGTRFPGNYSVAIEVEGQGLHTLLAVGLDAEGNVVAATEKYFFGVVDDDDNWTDMGDALFTEGIYAVGYDDIASETFAAKAQCHKTIEGYYRLVDPYAAHSELGQAVFTHSDHKHYIYINASDPQYVVIESSPVGVRIYGEGAIHSLAAKYAGTDLEAAAKQEGFFGTYDAATRTISIPDDTIFLGESEYQNGKFLLGNEGTQIVLPDPDEAGILGIATDAQAAPAEYFNLQGQRVSNPSAGTLLIRKQGGKVEKTVIR